LYRYYIKDKKIIDRLIEILDKMEKYSNDRVENKEAEGTK
jgi:hypothetical protein